jgi:Prenyltransferase and squalene oxidase repeat
LTAWAMLGLRAARVPADDRYLRAHEAELSSPTGLALAALAENHPAAPLLARVSALPNAKAINVTAWKTLALAGAGRSIPSAAVRFLLRHQTNGGGWGWAAGVAPDSNDTAVVVEALRAAGTKGRSIRRGIAFLRKLERPDGGFALTPGRGSDTQSTAWAIQAFVSARVPPPRAAFRYLARLRRADGSYRYSARYAVTPVWVTAQVLPAIERRSFPLP